MAIVTVSRGTYSGGRALAECLSEALEYRLLNREQLVTGAAKEFGASAEDLESALLYKPRFLEGKLTKLHYVYCVQAALAKAVQGDNIVYHGQAGHLLLTGVPHHLRLRVVADWEYRIAAAQRRSHLARDKAIAMTEELDRGRDEWVKWVYGVDRNDPSTYDLEINLERIPLEHACLTVEELIRRDFQTTPASQQILDDLVLGSEVRARIGLAPDIADDRVEVEASDGVVTISGTVRTGGDVEKVQALVEKLPGVRRVDMQLGTRW